MHGRCFRPSGCAPVYINCNGRVPRVQGSGVVWEQEADVYIRSDPRFIRFTDSDGNLTEPNWHMIGDAMYRPIPPWSQYLQANSIPGGDRDHALLFLHERCAKGGVPRIVAVEFSTGHTFREQIWISVINFDGIDRTEGLRKFCWDPRALINPQLGLYRAKFFEGEADPSDTSHFTIRFTHYGNGNGIEEGEILDGWLLSDDRVQLKVRDKKLTH